MALKAVGVGEHWGHRKVLAKTVTRSVTPLNFVSPLPFSDTKQIIHFERINLVW